MRFATALALTATLGGCSLLVSTSDLSGGAGRPQEPDASTDGATANAPDGEPAASSSSSSSSSGGTADSGATELPGLVGAWLFDGGNAADSSGNGHGGVFEGDAVVVMTDRGKAMQLSGDGSMNVPSLDGAVFPRTGTLSVWFQYSEMDGSTEQSIFDSWDRARNHLFVRHANGDPVGEMQISFQPADLEYAFSTGFNLARASWAHVVVTWDEGHQRAQSFLNGAKLDAEPYAGAFAPTNQLASFGSSLHGFVDDIRLYDRVLTDAEVATLP